MEEVEVWLIVAKVDLKWDGLVTSWLRVEGLGVQWEFLE